jgi:hypothetical protein
MASWLAGWLAGCLVAKSCYSKQETRIKCPTPWRTIILEAFLAIKEFSSFMESEG